MRSIEVIYAFTYKSVTLMLYLYVTFYSFNLGWDATIFMRGKKNSAHKKRGILPPKLTE